MYNIYRKVAFVTGVVNWIGLKFVTSLQLQQKSSFPSLCLNLVHIHTTKN